MQHILLAGTHRHFETLAMSGVDDTIMTHNCTEAEPGTQNIRDRYTVNII